MGSRSRAREAALKTLYQLDITRDPPEEGLKIFFRHHRVPLSSQAFVRGLVEGTLLRLKEIDERLAHHATHWSLDRMAIVDRNILRLGTFELLFSPETPPKVVINEAVELAKRFGTADSSKFVNGVLDSIHKAVHPQRRVEGFVDLHLHTRHSDGTFEPKEVVQRAQSAGLSAISITDHDTIAGLAAARAAAGPALEILTGSELTVSFKDRELHLLGYGFREDDPELSAYLSRASGNRPGRIQAMIARLNEVGVPVTFEEVEAVAGDADSLGRPHLAEALVKKGVVRTLNEAFDKYLGDHAPCFVKKATLSMADGIRLIRRAGGVAVLAHPYRLVEDEWVPEMVEQGLQGIEVYHSDHDAGVTESYRRMAERLRLLATGGSDCHGTRKAKGPLIGTVRVPYSCFERLKEAVQKGSGTF